MSTQSLPELSTLFAKKINGEGGKGEKKISLQVELCQEQSFVIICSPWKQTKKLFILIVFFLVYFKLFEEGGKEGKSKGVGKICCLLHLHVVVSTRYWVPLRFALFLFVHCWRHNFSISAKLWIEDTLQSVEWKETVKFALVILHNFCCCSY